MSENFKITFADEFSVKSTGIQEYLMSASDGRYWILSVRGELSAKEAETIHQELSSDNVSTISLYDNDSLVQQFMNLELVSANISFDARGYNYDFQFRMNGVAK